jgi:hypothetical protein
MPGQENFPGLTLSATGPEPPPGKATGDRLKPLAGLYVFVFVP